jgi:hypothetical protein
VCCQIAICSTQQILQCIEIDRIAHYQRGHNT